MSLFDIAKQNPFGKPVVSDAAPRYEIEFLCFSNKCIQKKKFKLLLNIQKKYYVVTFIDVLNKYFSCEFGSTEYYLKCMIGGALSCGLTHTAVVPLDLVKCRMQVDAAKYPSLGKGLKVITLFADK